MNLDKFKFFYFLMSLNLNIIYRIGLSSSQV